MGCLEIFVLKHHLQLPNFARNKTTEEVLDFSILYDKFVEGIEEKLLNGQSVELDTKAGGSVLVESISRQGNVIIKHHEGDKDLHCIQSKTN